MLNFFFYGTLMHPEVLQRVVRGTYRFEPALLRGFARYRVRGKTHPGMVEQAGGEVDGMIRFDVSVNDVKRLDCFEGAAYERRIVKPVLTNGEMVDCQTYLYRKEFAGNFTDEPWSISWFVQNGLKSFLDEYEGWSNVEK